MPAPLQPLDVCALDGFLCGLLLQPNDVSRDVAPVRHGLDARAAGLRCAAPARRGIAAPRAAQRAIAARQWFDPWVFELDAQASASECVLPWVAGFAAAMDRFPQLMRLDDARILEPLALLYLHFDPQDLEDADTLQQVIDTLEPPEDLGEAVQDIVRSVMLLADVTRPRSARHTARRPRRPDARTPRPVELEGRRRPDPAIGAPVADTAVETASENGMEGSWTRPPAALGARAQRLAGPGRAMPAPLSAWRWR